MPVYFRSGVPLVCAQPTNYRNHLNVVLVDAQLKGEYLGGLRVRAPENDHSIYTGDDYIDEERSGRIPPIGVDGDDVEVVLRPTGPS